MGDDATPDAPEAQPSIWTLLGQWATTLTPWQRYVLGKAIRNRKLSDEEIQTAYLYFQRDHGLLDELPADIDPIEPVAARPVEPLSADLLMCGVADVQGVNALPAGTGITFGPRLTLVYGRNGAGKSGYVRLLANACFCRHRPEVIGDIYAKGTPPPPSCRFNLSLGGTAQDPVDYTIGADNPYLRRFTVFDSAVARHLLTQQMPFEFKPAGFDVFPEMVRVYNKLAQKLDNDIVRHTKQNTFSSAFVGGTTPAYAAVSKLGSTTDIEKLRQLASYGAAETARLKEIDKLLVALRSQSPKLALETLAEANTDVTALRKRIADLADLFSEQNVADRKKLIDAAVESAALAVTLGTDEFQRPFFKAVGTSEWEEFAGKALALARKEREGYPDEGDKCLLCEQDLSAEARLHIETLFKFVQSDAKHEAASAQDRVNAAIADLSEQVFDHFGEAARVRTHVKRLAPPLEEEVQATFTALTKAKKTALTDLEGLKVTETAMAPPSVLASLDRLLERMEKDRERLSADDKEASITAMDDERRGLIHQHVLSQQLPQIETFVSDEKWRLKATSAARNLNQRSLTDKEKEFFAKVVGDKYRTHFAEECVGLDCDIPVEMQTMGREGRTVRTMSMKGGYKTTAILSEGEQRAIALADFLTEVAVNPAIAGLILDDPVNSQDHDRMKKIAARLVEEAKTRQVIVFTHDLPFLNAMFVAADDAGLEVEAHWIDRDDEGKPGRVVLGDAPVTMKAYDSAAKARDYLAEAKKLTGSKQVDQIRLGMAALRRTIEETVVKRLFKGVVPRWEDRVIVTGLRNVNWDNQEVERLCTVFEELSGYIEGHSHTDEAMGAPPKVSDLEGRIAEVESIIKWAKPPRAKPASTAGAT
ncbi:MAG TPA: hypothetical protein VN240_00350 [Propylenella sp.]|nr:hypothetical protein [Propylenella sp.]